MAAQRNTRDGKRKAGGAKKGGPVVTWKAPSPSHTRIEHPKPTEVADRVAYIADLMARNVWNARTTHRLQNELSEAWGVATSTIRTYSAEAGRGLLESVKEMRGKAAALALKTLSTVCARGPRSGLPGDKGAAVQASTALLKFAGLDAPDEDKNRPSTVRIVTEGQVATSPAMAALMGTKDGASPSGTAEGQAP